jgi:hypothetical protein
MARITGNSSPGPSLSSLTALARTSLWALLIPIAGVPRALAEVPEVLLTSPLALAFGAAPAIGDPRLSPDGSRMLFLQQNSEGASELRVLDFESGAIHTPLIGSMHGQDVEWCAWAKANRLVCELADIDHRRGGGPTVTAMQLAYVAINSDGTDEKRLRQICRDGIDPLPDDPQHIFVVCGGAGALVDLYSNRFVVQEDRDDLGAELSDGHGRVRISGRNMGIELSWYARTELEEDWQPLRVVNRMKFEPPLNPVGFSENLDELLRIGWNSGTWGLFALDLADGITERLVFAHPVVDVTHVDRLGAYPRIVAAAYTFNGPQRFILDERVNSVHDFVASRLPEHAIEVLDESWDQNVYLVRARLPNRAGEFYRVDMAGRDLENVGAEHPQLLGISLAPSRTIEIADPEGGSFSAHLTLPAGRDGPVPAVLIPRGAPTELDIASPNFLVQFLAASGYAVLQVNHRGPAQLGYRWDTDTAFVARQQSAADVALAGEHLVASGIALPDRLCALGWGFGAYVAAMTAIAHPQDLGCFVSVGGPLNPRVTSVRDARSFNPLLEHASPVRYAQDIEASTLLFDGTSNAQSTDLARALRRADREVVLVEYDHVDRRFEPAPYRTDMLVRIGEFLEKEIGAAN